MNEPQNPLPITPPSVTTGQMGAPATAVAMAPTSAQREQTIERLTSSFADDQLTMDEFERRAELVYGALTVVQLQQLVADLPGNSAAAASELGTSTNIENTSKTETIRTVFANTERRGSERVPRRLRLRTLFGNTELDYSTAVFARGITEIDVRCTFGNIEITVPRGVRVELDCSAILASVGSEARRFDDDGVREPNTPPIVVRLTGRAIFANVEVHVAGEQPRKDDRYTLLSSDSD